MVSRWLPVSLARIISGFLRQFLAGAVFPRQAWRQAVIVAASIIIKLIAVSHLMWAGLAFGVRLEMADYVFLMVFLGFIAVLAGSLKIVGGFTIAAVFALEGFGVAVEKALAMALVVQGASQICVAITGMTALWMQGLNSSYLRLPEKEAAKHANSESP